MKRLPQKRVEKRADITLSLFATKFDISIDNIGLLRYN